MHKYALVIAGQPRTFEFCFPSLKKHILDVYNPDVFICTDSDGWRVRDLYKPAGIHIAKQNELFDKAIKMRGDIPSVMPVNDLSVAWKLHTAMEMKSLSEQMNNSIYDTVIITRFDVKFRYVPHVEAKENTFHAPLIGGYWNTPPDEPGIHWGGLSAHLCWMSSQVADKVANIYFDQADYLTLATQAKENFGWAPEHVLKHYLDVNNIGIQFEDINMMLIRGTSNNPLSFHNHPLREYAEYLHD